MLYERLCQETLQCLQEDTHGERESERERRRGGEREGARHMVLI